MRRLTASILIAWIACAVGSARAAEAAPDPVSFGHKDWLLQCDNTRTCRAVGYQEDGGDSDPVSLMLTRVAGPSTPVLAQLTVSSENKVQGPLKLSAGRFSLGGLEGDSPQIPGEKVPELLRELLRSSQARVSAGPAQASWTLSLAGLNAVLLKMDEAQGRLDTSGALVKRGRRDESLVLAPLLPPQLPAFKTLAPTRARDSALLKPLLAAIDPKVLADQCNSPQIDAGSASVTRLSDHRVLLSVPCSMGAYNFTTLHWIARDQPPYSPEAQEANGDFDPKTGTVSLSMKGRGLGDCWTEQTWRFNGQGFVLAGQSSTGLCRGFPGGAWNLPEYVTR
ncbi:MAG: DUF1176 domain-containing protein [Curvibacter sp.]|nr:MAG: DUF1176 domain-containing protein [Curvibacter sp.]